MSNFINLDDLTIELMEINNTLTTMCAMYSSVTDTEKIIQSVENVNETLEKAVVLSRNSIEKLRPNITIPKPGAPTLPYLKISGEVRIIEYSWLHIKLNTLLPHCRFQTPKYLSDTLVRLLDTFKAKNGQLPFYQSAMMIIDEHCNINSRSVYDQDNKGWKAISNVLKGRIFPDDDQFSLGIALVSTLDEKPSCNIYIIDAFDTGDFFSMRSDGSLYL